jgi:hypothetical protein
MPSTRKVDVRLSADVSKMATQILTTQTLILHNLLASSGFERPGERIVQHPDSGVMVAVNPDGYRISYYCPGAPAASGRVDLPPSTSLAEVAHLARALHREDPDRNEQ